MSQGTIGPLNIVLCPNSFKDSLDGIQVCRAMQAGLVACQKRFPAISFNPIKIPLADGGDGTLDVLLTGEDCERVSVQVLDPLQRQLKADLGLLSAGNTAVIEMARASGLALLTEAERNPLKTSTIGTGNLMVEALERKVRKIIMCIGGSATNDGGIGMAHALGYRFLDNQGQELVPIGENLIRIERIDCSRVRKDVRTTEIVVACDVTNPLVGPQGAVNVYGPQKGLRNAEDQQILEKGLENLARKWIEFKLVDRDIAANPGAGAAGGLGAGLIAFCGGRLERGFDVVAKEVKLEQHISKAHLVITGEGRADKSSTFGKVLSGVAIMSKSKQVAAISINGSVDLNSIDALQQLGMQACVSIAPGPTTLDISKANSFEWIERATCQAVSLWLTGLQFGLKLQRAKI